jgi:hypothetical protein
MFSALSKGLQQVLAPAAASIQLVPESTDVCCYTDGTLGLHIPSAGGQAGHLLCQIGASLEGDQIIPQCQLDFVSNYSIVANLQHTLADPNLDTLATGAVVHERQIALFELSKDGVR